MDWGIHPRLSGNLQEDVGFQTGQSLPARLSLSPGRMRSVQPEETWEGDVWFFQEFEESGASILHRKTL